MADAETTAASVGTDQFLHPDTLVGRTIPDEAEESRWEASDGWSIRRIDWPVRQKARGSILFMPGRGDFYEKYLETLSHWSERGFAVTASDWRGQGGSGRFLDDQFVGHVPDFSVWVRDLAELWSKWTATHPGPHILAGHSMGGHLVLRATAEGAIDPDGLILSTPMLAIRGAHLPDWAGHRLAKVMGRFGSPERRAWGVNERPGRPIPFRQNLLTHDDRRYADEQWWMQERSELQLGPASWHWVERAYASIRLLRSKGYLEGVRCPTYIFATHADELVGTARTIMLAKRIADYELDLFGSEARHEMLREVDDVRDRVLEGVDRFLDRIAPRD